MDIVVPVKRTLKIKQVCKPIMELSTLVKYNQEAELEPTELKGTYLLMRVTQSKSDDRCLRTWCLQCTLNNMKRGIIFCDDIFNFLRW